jgi:ribosome biogenesis protein YTM1
MDIDGEDVSRRLHVKFVTKLDSPFKVPVNSVAIPSNVTRLGLSSIVNSIIESENPEWKTEPFDFLIDGELIRMSLEEFLLAKGISAVMCFILIFHYSHQLVYLELVHSALSWKHILN